MHLSFAKEGDDFLYIITSKLLVIHVLWGWLTPGLQIGPVFALNIIFILLYYGKGSLTRHPGVVTLANVPGCWMYFGMFPSLLCLFVLMYAGKGSRVQHFFSRSRGGAAAFQESLEAVSDNQAFYSLSCDRFVSLNSP